MQALTRASRTPWLKWSLPALAAALLATLVQYQLAERQNRMTLAVEARELARQVQADSSDGKVMGGAILMGQTEDSVKRLLTGQLVGNAPELVEDFHSILEQYEAENAFVLNGDGDTLAYLNNKGAAPGLGRNLAHRPYWRRALAGQANVYPAVGGTSHGRGLYFAAPVYSGPTRHTPVSGAYVIKIPMTPIDALLGRGKHTALLLSPDGVVFAASEPEWVLRLAAPLPTARRAALHAGQQFGQLFADATPTSAPASAAIAASASTSPSAAPIQNATPPDAEAPPPTPPATPALLPFLLDAGGDAVAAGLGRRRRQLARRRVAGQARMAAAVAAAVAGRRRGAGGAARRSAAGEPPSRRAGPGPAARRKRGAHAADDRQPAAGGLPMLFTARRRAGVRVHQPGRHRHHRRQPGRGDGRSARAVRTVRPGRLHGAVAAHAGRGKARPRPSRPLAIHAARRRQGRAALDRDRRHAAAQRRRQRAVARLSVGRDGRAERGRGAGRGQTRGRGRDAQQVHVPGQYEPRNPHADERHHRPVAPGAAHQPEPQAGRLRRQDPPGRHLAAGHHQRHPRLLQDRGRQDRPRTHRLPA